MNENNEMIELMFQIMDMFIDLRRNHRKAYEDLKHELWTATGDIQKEINVMCDTNEKVLATYNPMETAVCDVIGSARTATAVNFDPLIEAINAMDPEDRPAMSNGLPLVSFLEANRFHTFSPQDAASAIRAFGVERLAPDLQPIVRDFLDVADESFGKVDFDFGARVKQQADFLTGDHVNNPCDAALIAMVEAYNSRTPLKGDELVAFMTKHPQTEHEFGATLNTLRNYDGKLVTAEMISGFIGYAGEHFSDDLINRVKPGLEESVVAEAAGEHKAISVLREDEREKAKADPSVNVEKETLLKLRKAFGTLAEGKGNVFYDTKTNTILDPAAAISSADEHLSDADKKKGVAHASLAQYNRSERKNLGFTCAWANMSESIDKGLEQIKAAKSKEIDAAVQKAIVLAHNRKMPYERAQRVVNGMLNETLYYNKPGDFHKNGMRYGDFREVERNIEQNKNFAERIFKDKHNQNEQAKKADMESSVDTDNVRNFGAVNAGFEDEHQRIDNMTEEQLHAEIRKAEEAIMAGVRSLDKEAREKFEKGANEAEADRASYVNRDNILVKAFPNLYHDAVASMDGNDRAGMALTKTAVAYANSYAVWLVGMTNMYSSERDYQSLGDLRRMIDDGSAVAMYASYIDQKNPDSSDLHNAAVSLFANRELLRQMPAVQTVAAKVDGYCAMHGVQAEGEAVDRVNRMSEYYVFEPGVDRPIPLNEIKTPEQISAMTEAMLENGQEEEAKQFVEKIAHRSVIEARNNPPAKNESFKPTSDDKQMVNALINGISESIETGAELSAVTLFVVGVYEEKCLKPRGETLASTTAKMADNISPALVERINQISVRAAEVVSETMGRSEARKAEKESEQQRTRTDI